MRPASTELYELISTLNQQELRYIKIFIQFYNKKDGGDLYTLFCEIEKTKNYDEDVIKEKLEKRPYLRDYFAQAKMKLFDQIMKALRSFHSSGGSYFTILSNLADAKILMDRSLFKMSVKRLNRLDHFLENREGVFSAASSFLRGLVYSNSYYNECTIEDLEQLREKQLDFTDKHRKHVYITNAYDILNYNLVKHDLSKKSAKMEIVNKVNALLKEAEPLDKVFFSDHIVFLQVKYNLQKLKGEPNQALECLLKALSLFEENPDQKLPNITSYHYINMNVAIHYSAFGEYEKSIEYVDKLLEEGPKFSTGITLAKRKLQLSIFKLEVYIKAGNYLEAEKQPVLNLDANPEKSKHITVYDHLYLMHLIATLSYKLKNYRAALRVINNLLNDKRLNSYDFIKNRVEHLRFLVFLKQEKYELLLSEIALFRSKQMRSEQRFSKSQNIFTELIESLIKKEFTTKPMSKKERSEKLLELKNSIEKSEEESDFWSLIDPISELN